MIWPVVVRYLVAILTGYAWVVGTTLLAAVASLALVALLTRDLVSLTRKTQ